MRRERIDSRRFFRTERICTFCAQPEEHFGCDGLVLQRRVVDSSAVVAWLAVETAPTDGTKSTVSDLRHSVLAFADAILASGVHAGGLCASRSRDFSRRGTAGRAVFLSWNTAVVVRLGRGVKQLPGST